MSLLEIVPIWIRGIPDNLKTQEMFNEAMREGPYNLQHVPDHFKTEEICNETVDIEPLYWRMSLTTLNTGDVLQSSFHRTMHPDACPWPCHDPRNV